MTDSEYRDRGLHMAKGLLASITLVGVSPRRTCDVLVYALAIAMKRAGVDQKHAAAILKDAWRDVDH